MKLTVGTWMLYLVVAGCQRDHTADRLIVGVERSSCRPDRTCDPGLVCLSDLCVRPPPADCDAVAEQLASIDLGNYAEPEDRAPVVARYAAACAAALITRREAHCIDLARDRSSAALCVPRMAALSAR
jgi:hypothetical protein